MPAYAYRDFWSGKPKSVRWLFKISSYLVAPLCVLIFNSAHTVGVYHDTRLISTFRRSMERLDEGSSMVIFPECYDEHNNIVHAFQDRISLSTWPGFITRNPARRCSLCRFMLHRI